jgi:hypothetical protein
VAQSLFGRLFGRAVCANETVVLASELQEAMSRIKQLEGAPVRKTLENEILMGGFRTHISTRSKGFNSFPLIPKTINF